MQWFRAVVGVDRCARARAREVFAVSGLAVLIASCGASHQSICEKSLLARTQGAYDNVTPEAAKAADLQYGYSCASACYDGFNAEPKLAEPQNSATCVESALLSAEADPLEKTDEVIKTCADGSGPAAACAWIDKHRADIEVWKRQRAETDARPAAPEPAAPPSMSPGDAQRAIAGAVAKLQSEAEGKGQRLIRDQEYSLQEYGHVSFDLSDLFRGSYYVRAVIGSRTNSFKAEVGGGGFNTMVMDERYVDGNSYVRCNGFTNDAATNEATPRVFITATGGDRGPIRVLLFQKD
ncbi:MAG: hypothetical protein ACOYOB_20315 [Myxococcota bacterium]